MDYMYIAKMRSVWTSIKVRCFNEKNIQYKNYGGRGITICPQWLDFNKFMEDLHSSIGERPNGDYELDRIDNDKGYEPGNMRWSTIKQNQRNKRNNHYIDTHLGKMCKSELIEKLAFTRKQFDRYVEAHGIENLLERFKNNDIPQKFVPLNPTSLLGKHGNLNLLKYEKTKLGWLYDVMCDCGNKFTMNQTSLKRRKFFMCQKCNKKGDLNPKRAKTKS